MEFSTVIDFTIPFDDFKSISGVLKKAKELKNFIINKYDVYKYQLIVDDELIEGKDCEKYFDEFIDYVMSNASIDEDGLYSFPDSNPYHYEDRPELDCIAYYGEGDMEFTQSFSLNEDGIRVFVGLSDWYTSNLQYGFLEYINIYHMLIDTSDEYLEFSPAEENESAGFNWIANKLTDSAFSSSSDWNRNHAAKFARFDSKPKFANWSAGKNEVGEWLQIDLGETREINAVRVQGRFNHPQWVTKYDLWIGEDLSAWKKFENITGPNGQDEFTEFDFSGEIQTARYLRFLPTSWENHISMRVDVCVSESENQISNNIQDSANSSEKNWIIDKLPDSAFSTSSDFNGDHAGKFARFNSRHAVANWSAKKNKVGEWLEVDLGETMEISAVRVQGRFNHSQWVTRYNLAISTDQTNWTIFENLKGADGEDAFKEFELPKIISGRFVRFSPTEWNKHISMRVDIAVAGTMELSNYEEEEPEENDENGFASMSLAYGDNVSEETARIYFGKWQVASTTYNGMLGITCVIPPEASVLIDPVVFPELSSVDLKSIEEKIASEKIIPILNFLESAYSKYAKKIWWVVPFCIWRDDTACPMFADKNGIYLMTDEEIEEAQLVPWDDIKDIEFEAGYDDDSNVNRMYLNLGDHYVSIDELVDNEKGNGSFLGVLFAIYNVRKATIEASHGAPDWYEGVGGEGFISFESGKDLADISKWKDPERPNPAEYGHKPTASVEESSTDENSGLEEFKAKFMLDPDIAIAFVYVCVAGVDGSIVEKEEDVVIVKLSEWGESGEMEEKYQIAKEIWKGLDGKTEKEYLEASILFLKQIMQEETINSLMGDIFQITDADGKVEDSEKAIVNYIISLIS